MSNKESYKIGSFNVKNLSYAASGRDLDRIANLIKRFDIVALQEVLSEGGILKGRNLRSISGRAQSYERSLLARLGTNWDCRWLNPETKSKYYPYLGDDNRGEGYAFIWNTDKFELPRKDSNTLIEPYVEHRYTTQGDNVIRLIRDPGIGRFKVKGRPVEIRLITTHIVFGKPKEENFAIDLPHGATKMRINEFFILAGWIYKKVDDACMSIDASGTVATVLLGDYNLNLRTSNAKSPYVPPVAYFDSKGRPFRPQLGENNKNAPIKMYTLQDGLTTLKKDGEGLVNNFDHFSVKEDKINYIKGIYKDTKGNVRGTTVIDGIHEGVEATDSDEESKYNTYRTRVSDHLPIMMEIYL